MGSNQDIKRGFNHGYLLQQKNPDLAMSLADGISTPTTSYAEGFISGVVQCVKDRGNDVSKYIEKKKDVGRELL